MQLSVFAAQLLGLRFQFRQNVRPRRTNITRSEAQRPLTLTRLPEGAGNAGPDKPPNGYEVVVDALRGAC